MASDFHLMNIICIVQVVDGAIIKAYKLIYKEALLKDALKDAAKRGEWFKIARQIYLIQLFKTYFIPKGNHTTDLLCKWYIVFDTWT